MSTINIVLFGGLLIIVGCILKCSCLRNCVSVGAFGCTEMTADTWCSNYTCVYFSPYVFRQHSGRHKILN